MEFRVTPNLKVVAYGYASYNLLKDITIKGEGRDSEYPFIPIELNSIIKIVNGKLFWREEMKKIIALSTSPLGSHFSFVRVAPRAFFISSPRWDKELLIEGLNGVFPTLNVKFRHAKSLIQNLLKLIFFFSPEERKEIRDLVTQLQITLDELEEKGL